MYNVGSGQGLDNAHVNYHEIDLLLLNSNYDLHPHDDLEYI
jgi:hypothetical protein